MIDAHALVAQDANGRGMFRAVCRCGKTSYGQRPEVARDRIYAHIASENFYTRRSQRRSR